MKELTIQEKAKRYDEAIKLVNSKWHYKDQPCFIDVSEIFPEITETKDEIIRKWFIKYFQEYKSKGIKKFDNVLKVDDILDWLERQGKQNPVDKVEPKFHGGQWIIWKDKCYKVNYNGCGYELIDQNGLSTSLEYRTIDENAHLWTIEDVKEGDAISYKDEILLYKDRIKNYNKQQISFEGFIYNCCYDGKRFIRNGIYSLMEEDKIYIHPATKEQRKLLFTKIKESGYKWNENKKELIKL